MTWALFPHGPRMHLSMSYGAGLQSARSYCSGSANTHLFENMITNAAHIWHEPGNDFLDHGQAHEKRLSHTLTDDVVARQMALSSTLAEDSLGLASLCMKKTFDVLELDSPFNLSKDLELFFPLCTSTSCLGPHQNVVTILSLALDPPLNLLVEKEPMKSDKALMASERLLSDAVRSTLCTIQNYYMQHFRHVSLIEATLRLHNMWPKRLDVSHLEYSVGSSTSSADLKVHLPGWRKYDVELALADISLGFRYTRTGAPFVFWHLTEVPL